MKILPLLLLGSVALAGAASAQLSPQVRAATVVQRAYLLGWQRDAQGHILPKPGNVCPSGMAAYAYTVWKPYGVGGRMIATQVYYCEDIAIHY